MNRGWLRRVRRFPWFFAAASLLVLSAAAGAVDTGLQWRRRQRLAAEASRLRIELLSPQARPELIAAAEAELQSLDVRLAESRSGWPTMSNTGAGEPPERLGAYAELMARLEGWRTRARAAGVALAKDERFGFAAEVAGPPPAAEAAELLRSITTVDAVLDAFFAARPARLIGVWLEPADAARSARGEGRFRLEATRSVRVSGLAETRALRIEFDGSTASLRRFLNQIVAGSGGLVVREVAVAAVEAKDAKDRVGSVGAEGRRFGVTLELVSLATGAAVDQRPAGAASGDEGVWRAGGMDLFARNGAIHGAVTEHFHVAGAEEPPAESWGIELVGVRRKPLRWRVVGCAAPRGGASRMAVLEERASGRSVLLGVGDCDARTGTRVTALAITRARDGSQVVAVTLAEPDEAEPVRLGTQDGTVFAQLLAMVRVRDREELVELAAGGTVRAAEAEFRVTTIREEPAEVEVVRTALEGAAPETFRLRCAPARQNL